MMINKPYFVQGNYVVMEFKRDMWFICSWGVVESTMYSAEETLWPLEPIWFSSGEISGDELDSFVLYGGCMGL